MPIQTPLAVAIFLTIWWIVLFAVLPFGVRNHQEEAENLPKGADPGAPVAPHLLKKAIATTLISAVVWVGIVVLANLAG